jgi:hypothetical protein
MCEEANPATAILNFMISNQQTEPANLNLKIKKTQFPPTKSSHTNYMHKHLVHDSSIRYQATMPKQLALWFTLPKSKYDYSWDFANANTRPVLLPKNSFLNSLSKKNENKSPLEDKSPFEGFLDDLNKVMLQYLDGTALMYIREVFEPADPEFDFLPPKVKANVLVQEQIDRLRILILPERREEILVAYLEYYDMVNNSSFNNSSTQIFTAANNVISHFDGFKRRYSAVRDIKEKFDLIFGFSFAIKKYSSWMYNREQTRARQQMVSGLARHWRQLLNLYSPEQIGLDREFSYPALLAFLKSFKDQVESIGMCGDIKFVYERAEFFENRSSSDEWSIPSESTSSV